MKCHGHAQDQRNVLHSSLGCASSKFCFHSFKPQTFIHSAIKYIIFIYETKWKLNLNQTFKVHSTLHKNETQNTEHRHIMVRLGTTGATAHIYAYRWSNSITILDRPRGFQEVEAPRFQDSRQMKVVRSALCTGRLYPHWYSFLLEAESTIVRPEGLYQWKIPVTNRESNPRPSGL